MARYDTTQAHKRDTSHALVFFFALLLSLTNSAGSYQQVVISAAGGIDVLAVKDIAGSRGHFN